MSLVNYSDTSESEIENESVYCSQESNSNCIRLPAAKQVLGNSKTSDAEDDLQDDPLLHDGRIRSFKHVRGNWATYVYIPISLNEFKDVQNFCFNQLNELGNFKLITDLHVSLSKTVVLQYHMIELFMESLKSAFSVCDSFQIGVNQLMVYTNNERTRTFLALKLDHLYIERMLSLLKIVNDVMNNFRQSTFYEEPSFHVSFLWCLGDKFEMITSCLPQLENGLKDNLTIHINVQTICCKSGCKEYIFKLR